HRTFGGLIRGEALVRVDEKTLKTAGEVKRLRLAMFTHTITPANGTEWLAAIEKNAAKVESIEIDKLRSAHRKWWDQFWNRSWIRASGTPAAEAATRAYVLQRFVTAGAGRGQFPIKFNGSIFTVDGVYNGVNHGPDFRRWGGCYWFQNTRLIYWPMLAAGDLEMMRPLFRMYENALPLARLRNRIYFGHDGCFFPETMTFFGTYHNGGFGWGWRKDGKPGDPVSNRYIRYHYNSTLELLALMLDYYAYTEDKEFLQKELLPIADEYLQWWDKHWARDADGKLKMSPSNALETYWDITNPAQDIAGLTWDINRLLRLSDEDIGPARRRRWSDLLKAVPKLPTMTRKKKRVLAPADLPLPKRTNVENPELYAVFPYRIYGVGKPDLRLALDTFNTRLSRANYCWFQDDTHAAMLGLAKIARDDVCARARKKNPESRFPAFWGPNNDWTPDEDHGGNLLMAMQSMLLQSDGRTLHVLPAWPKDWNVDFKLCAPGKTTVQGVVRHGKLRELNVTPRPPEECVQVHNPQ
ncbi:MAG: DUF5703 domain-containing protein, partial [Thermoguttaceae bacterium]